MADELVALDIVDSCGKTTVHEMLEKSELQFHLTIPPKQNAAFVAGMGNVM